MIMKKNKRFRILIIAGVFGVLYTVLILYRRRGGYLINYDIFSILFVILFLIGLIYYYKMKG
jgi:hypothetical protein